MVYELIFINSFQKEKEKQNLDEGEHKKGIVNVIQPTKASDTDAYDSSGDDFFGKQEALQRTQTTRLSWDSSNTVQLYDLAKLT